MERRILISGIILTVSIIIFIGVFFIHSRSKDGANPIKSIPQNAAMVLRLNGPELLTSLSEGKTKVWKDLQTFPLIKNIEAEINTIDSLIKQIPYLSEHLIESDLYLSGHLSGSKKLYYLSVVPLPETFNQKDVIRILDNHHSISYSERKYEGKSILNISGSNEKNYSVCISNGLLLFSSSPLLVEDAIRQLTLANSLLDNPHFAKMYKGTGKNKQANLFIDLQKSGKLFSLIANNSIAESARKNKNTGNWVELDINIKEETILLNGFTHRVDTAINFIKTISSFEPVKITIPEILPSSTSGYLAYGISSPKEYYQEYLKYLREIGKLPTYRANLRNMNAKYGINFDEVFLNMLDDQLALANKFNPSTNSNHEYIIFKCKSGIEARNELEALTEKIKPLSNGQLKYSYSPDNDIKFTIYRVPIYPLFGRLMGDLFKDFEDNYIVIIENYLVVSSTYNGASQFLYDYMLKRTLSINPIYREFTNNLSTKSYLLVYNNNASNINYFEKYFSQETRASLEKNKAVFEKAQTTGLQISEVSDLPYFNIFMQHHDDYRGKPRTVWESLLDTSVSMKPKFVVNHYTKQNDIAIQDDGNNLYLINQAGRILWKVSLNEKINSEIFQVDYYKNGKFQMLFSTTSSIHLIDRNGNYVERYPIKLRSESTAGLAVFDYESNRNYRIFIPCKNKKVYVYSIEGSIISGWNFKGTDHAVSQSINHFRISEKDYIIFGDEASTYILDRKGAQRVSVEKPFTKSKNNSYYPYDTGNLENSCFITTNTKGTICKIYTSGKIEQKNVGDFSEDHFFDFKDVNADGKSDFIFLSDNKLSVFDNNGEEIFSSNFRENISQRPVYYHFSHNDRKIGIVTEDNKIYLLNNNGETYKGFPVEGKTKFSIGYFDLTNSRFNLIVGGSNNFLYNYAVE